MTVASVFAFVQSSVIVDIAIAVLFAEIVLLTGLTVRRRPSLGLSIVLNGLSGISLLFALRTQWQGSNGFLVAVFLGVAFLAHISDLVIRLRR